MAVVLAVAGVTGAVAANQTDAPPRIAFLANGHVAADALAAGPIAGQLGAPVFTTEQATLSPAAREALQNHNPELVIVLGGPVAISDAVVDRVEAATGLPETDQSAPTGGVVRVAGGDRFATAAAVADLLSDYHPAFVPSSSALDADTLDGLDSKDFASSDQACVAGAVVEGIDAEGQLTCTTDAFPDTLPSGRTLRGVYDVASDGGGVQNETAIAVTDVSFQFPLAQKPTPRFLADGDPATTECPGTAEAPEAAAGFLCVYEAAGAGYDWVTVDSPVEGVTWRGSPYGFSVSADTSDASTLLYSRGSWAVTAQ